MTSTTAAEKNLDVYGSITIAVGSHSREDAATVAMLHLSALDLIGQFDRPARIDYLGVGAGTGQWEVTFVAIEDVAHLAFEEEMMQREFRATHRMAIDAPLPHGVPMNGGADYFCLPCWLDGEETGAHGHDSPPCDFEPRGAFDPR